jgi:hypothetical protein
MKKRLKIRERVANLTTRYEPDRKKKIKSVKILAIFQSIPEPSTRSSRLCSR